MEDVSTARALRGVEGGLALRLTSLGWGVGGAALCSTVLVFVRSEWVTVRSGGGGLVGGDVGGAAAVAGGGLGPLDVEVEQLHLSGRWEEETAAGLEEESSALLCSALLARPPSGTCNCFSLHSAVAQHIQQQFSTVTTSSLPNVHVFQYFTLFDNIFHYCN